MPRGPVGIESWSVVDEVEEAMSFKIVLLWLPTQQLFYEMMRRDEGRGREKDPRRVSAPLFLLTKITEESVFLLL